MKININDKINILIILIDDIKTIINIWYICINTTISSI